MQYYIICIICLHPIQSRRCIMIIALQPQPVSARRNLPMEHPPPSTIASEAPSVSAGATPLQWPAPQPSPPSCPSDGRPVPTGNMCVCCAFAYHRSLTLAAHAQG